MTTSASNKDFDGIVDTLAKRDSRGHQWCFYMRDDTHRILKLLSVLEQRPMSIILARAVNLYAQEYTKADLSSIPDSALRARSRGKRKNPQKGETKYAMVDGVLTLIERDGNKVAINR